MKRFVKIGVLSLVAAVGFSAAFHRLRAQGARTPNHTPGAVSSVSTRSGAPSSAITHVLHATYVTQGEPFTTEAPATFLPIDSPITFYCPAAGGCTLGIEQNVQVSDYNLDFGNEWAPAFLIDGGQSTSPFVGVTNIDGFWSVGASTQTIKVTKGNHTVQSNVWSYYGLTLGIYNINYNVYVP